MASRKTIVKLPAGSLRTIVAACCMVASVAIVVHHSVAAADMPGMPTAETCVSVAAHAVETPAAPLMLLLALAGAVLLVGFLLDSRPRPAQPLARARAAPPDFRVPLRC